MSFVVRRARRPRRRLASVATALAAAASVAAAAAASGSTVRQVGVDPAASATTGSASLLADLSGFLVGDFDEASNPDGTRTLPGLFGGSGNQPVDLDLLPSFAGPIEGVIAGGFELAGDPADGTITVDGLALDLLSEGSASLPLVIELLYESFRTFDPDSLFPGGVPIDLPFGEALLTRLEAAQLGAAIGTASPAGTPGTWTIEVAVPVLLSIEGEALGTPIAGLPLPVVLPLEGTLAVAEDGSSTVELAVSVAISEEDEGPFPGAGIADLPFELPTVLPPGGTAGLLVTADLLAIAVDLSIDLVIVGSAPGEPALPGDVDGDGAVDFDDLLAVLAAWTT